MVLLVEREYRIEQQQKIIEYFESNEETETPFWYLPDDGRIL
ncbi:MAG: hypothetical protein ACRC9L_06110 [Brevinema sp.]